MSRFSGKCDLYDDIFLIGRQPEESEADCFERFKKETGGYIYQLVKVPLNEHNIKFECDLIKKNPRLTLYCPGLARVEHLKEQEDKRYKSGKRKNTYYTYSLLNKEYTLEELNTFGYTRKKLIKIDTIFDLIPYFTYLVSMEYHSQDSREIVISNHSYLDSIKANELKWGYSTTIVDQYIKELQEYTIDTVREQFLGKD